MSFDSSSALSARKLGFASVGFALTSMYFWLRSKSSNLSEDLFDIMKLLKYRNHLINMLDLDWSVADFFESKADAHPDNLAILFADTNTSYTYRQLDEASNKVAHWALSQGIKRGDVVALMMDNRPEFIFLWLGLCKIKAITAFINTNLSGKPLEHSFSVSKARHFIIGGEHVGKGVSAKVNLVGDENAGVTGKWYVSGALEGLIGIRNTLTPIDNDLLSQPITRLDHSIRSPSKATDVLFYIYTSGTTGLPKASIINHLRFYTTGLAFSAAFNITPTDRIYCPLPLYHSAGGMIGVGTSWYSGSCLVFRKKFSVSRFWEDAATHNCSIVQYIGELCRYLILQPPSPFDSTHKVRLAIGNGMRADVWKQFQERFNVGQIGEFYAATEGNATLLNTRNKFGAVGFITPIIAAFYPVKLVRFDPETELPIRSPSGLCIPCRPGEIGELVGLIDDSDPTRKFDGYTDKKATEKKILTDVFKKGDRYFRTGDLLRADEEGFMFFVDRIGDTFRWKGENVATSEVEGVINSVEGVHEVNVYGVQVPGHDGRAGMACLVASPSFCLDALFHQCEKELPGYARPVFVRVRRGEMEVTTTFKHKKNTLRDEGFDPSSIRDDLYFRDDQLAKYVPLTPDLYRQISTQTIRARF